MKIQRLTHGMMTSVKKVIFWRISVVIGDMAGRGFGRLRLVGGFESVEEGLRTGGLR
jgi:hypothetical protein